MSRLRQATGAHPAMSASKRAPERPLGMSNIELYLANLRLLDLDLRNDWPDVTTGDLDTENVQQNQKRRIACVEWTLYRLFEIWDPPTTRDKLKPFFPPLEPLQSLNLRAALYRCLSVIKKDGVLGRDAVLRKTMLDECKGEKLEEVLVTFSAVAVRKQMISTTRARDAPIAQRLAATTIHNPAQVHIMPSFLIAHRRGLSTTLDRRAKQERRLRDLEACMLKSRIDLDDRQEASHTRQFKEAGLSSKHVEMIVERVQEGWAGNSHESTVLLDGGVAHTSDGLMASSFGAIWERTLGERAVHSSSSQASLLERVNDLAEQQNRRLQAWKARANRATSTVMSRNTNDMPANRVSKPPKLSFESHQRIRLDNNNAYNKTAKKKVNETTPYDNILSEMDKSLRHAKARNRTPNLPRDVRNSAVAESKEYSSLPKAPVLAVREAAVSPSHDLFSPAKGHYHDSAPTGEQIPSSLDEDQITQPPLGRDVQRPLTGCSAGSGTAVVELLVGFQTVPLNEFHTIPKDEPIVTIGTERGVSWSSIVSTRLQPFPAGEKLSFLDVESPMLPETGDATPVDQDNHAEVVVSTPTPGPQDTDAYSLEGFAPTPTSNGDTHLPSSPAVAGFESSIEQSSSSFDTSPERPHMSLAESTRLSVADSLARQAQSPSTNLQRYPKSRSSLYAVNQFETPIKAKAGMTPASIDDLVMVPGTDTASSEEVLQSTVVGKGRRDVTPINKLFDQDADYASVFKSRPKIKTSPLSSPVRR